MPHRYMASRAGRISDIAGVAAGITATKEGTDACIVGDGIGIADHTAQRCLQLQLIDLVLHILHPVAADGIQNLLGAPLLGLYDVARVDSAVVVDAVNGSLGGAAALSQLGLHCVKIPQGFIPKVAEAILETGVHVVDCVVVAGDACLQLRKAVGVAKVGFGDRIAACSGSTKSAKCTVTKD